ncbi:hypothetical protein [Amycolatopsis speibonae]|uniref:Uncharacterized protein n=1 Tax=Amycolatopsis speibonae TaxID=1450224 RepID=A0ABV7P8E5_9PSEU
MTEQRPNWDKITYACRRYLEVFNDDVADEIALGSLAERLKVVVNGEVPSAATQTAEQAQPEELSVDEIGGFLYGAAVTQIPMSECDDTARALLEEFVIQRRSDDDSSAGSPVTETTTQPRVFFPGDTVPAGVWALGRGGLLHEPSSEGWEVKAGPQVEVHVPSFPEEWQAAVDRARAGWSGDASETEK